MQQRPVGEVLDVRPLTGALLLPLRFLLSSHPLRERVANLLAQQHLPLIGHLLGDLKDALGLRECAADHIALLSVAGLVEVVRKEGCDAAALSIHEEEDGETLHRLEEIAAEGFNGVAEGPVLRSRGEDRAGRRCGLRHLWGE